MKKLICLLLTLSVCLSMTVCAAAGSAEETESAYLYAQEDYFEPCVESFDSFESEVMPFYVDELENVSELTVWFVNGYHDVAFLAIEDIVCILTDLIGEGCTLTTETGDDGSYVMLSRENGAFMIADYGHDRLIFSDLQYFLTDPKAVNGLDLVNTITNTEGDKTLISRSALFYKGANYLTIDMAHYQIPMIFRDGIGYLPLQTVADLLISRIGAYLLYNGEAVILSGSLSTSGEEEPQTVGDIYYSAPEGKKSEMLKIFTYNELCMALDHCYGLKEEHCIETFCRLFFQADLDQKLYSDDAAGSFQALYELIYGCFADLHSGLNAPSYLTVFDPADLDGTLQYYAIGKIRTTLQVYSGVRSQYYPEGCPGYEEVGNTAYITFDTFSGEAEDYYALELTPDPDDTIALIMYANEQIRREDSPIENVVLDLTCNTGGDLNAAVSVIAWMLGDCCLSLEDTATGAQSTNVYTFDANRDGEIDENDYCGFLDYQLYCLVSPNSFSCGNLVPFALQSSCFVTLIGDDSSGGACAVYPMSSADGNIFQISGPFRISVMNNGIYYNVDDGVEVENYIDKLAHLYDREYLTRFINDLP